MYDASGNAFTTFSNAGWTFAACAKGKRYDPVGPGDIKGETSDIYVALIGASLTGSGSPTEDDTDGAHSVDQHYTGCRRFSTGTYPTRPFPYFPLPTGETWNGHTLAGVELGWFKGLPTFPNWWDAEAETPAFTVPPNGYWVRSVVTGIYVEMGSITFTWRFHTYDAEGRMISEGEPVTLKVYGDGIGSTEGNEPTDP